MNQKRLIALATLLALSGCGHHKEPGEQPAASTQAATDPASAGTASHLPDFLAPPPGTTELESIADPNGRLTMLQSQQPPEAVIAHYRQRLTTAGYKLNDMFSEHAKVPGRTTIFGQKSENDFVSVVASVEDGKTQIAITVAKK